MTKTYKIRKGIAVPEPTVDKTKNKQPSKVALTLSVMEVGDSFVVPDALEAMKAVKVVQDFSTRERGRSGVRKFVTRRSKKGFGVWRVK